VSRKAGGHPQFLSLGAARPVAPRPSPLVNQAAALCEQGRLDEAEALIRGVLTFAPRDDAALHLMGMIAYGKGEGSRAIDLYRQAIAINGRVASYHGNLGNAYLELETPQPAEAARSFRRVLALNPGLVLAQFGLGLALIGLKDYPAAAKELERAARASPDHADTHLNLGIALTELGRLDDAVAHCRRAVALNPGYAGNHLKLGIALRIKGDFQEAFASITRAIQLDSKIPEAYYQLGITCRALSRPAQAVTALGRALALRPDMAEAIGQIGSIRYDLQQYDEAIGCYERALAITPQSAALHHANGRARYSQARFAEARAAFTRALELEPDKADNYAAIGRTYEAEGHFEEAIAWQEKALARQPDNAEAHYSLAIMHSAADRKSRIAELERTLGRGSLPRDQRAALNFTLGKLYDEDGDYDRAFGCFKAGNDLHKDQYPFQIDEHAALVDQEIAAFSRELFAEKGRIGSESERPVFVVGMPRSGTTLVEQILASHPQIHGHGELEDVQRLADSLPERLVGGRPYPECIAALDAATARDLAEAYLRRLEAEAADTIRSVDKMPKNFLFLGLIALLFPRARLIHCLRDPRDTCLSCYFQDFGPRQPFSWDLEWLGRHYRDYQRLMAHWHAALPMPILDVPYEALVGDQAVWTHRIVDFLGLPWDERCLTFYKTSRPVFTSSAWQVRQPIYASSIDRWRHYAKHLGPLFGAFGAVPLME
jgi:tetratricopeptide (TPR) repeat protein